MGNVSKTKKQSFMVWLGSVFAAAGFVCQILIPLHIITVPGDEKLLSMPKEIGALYLSTWTTLAGMTILFFFYVKPLTEKLDKEAKG